MQIILGKLYVVLFFALRIGTRKNSFLIIAYHHMLAFVKKKCEDSKHKNMLKLIISVDSLSELSIL